MLQRIAAALGLAALLAGPAVAQTPLKTAVDGTFAPHAMPRMGGGTEGFNIDLANEIAQRLKRPIEITSTQFAGILPALQAGTLDFVAAPVTVTRERAENLLFTEGYLNTDFQFLVRRGSPKVAAMSELRGRIVTVNRGSAYDSWARGLTEQIGWTVESFGTQADAVQAVLSGRAFANITGNTVGAWAARQNPQLELSLLHSTGLVWAVALRRDSGELRGQIEDAIECMKRDGTIARLHEKWFAVKAEPGSAAMMPFPGAGVPGMPGHDAAPRNPSCG